MADYTVAFSGLNSLLSGLAANTAETPYKIKITGLTTSNIGEFDDSGTLGNILYNNKTKYVDLSETELPSNLTSLSWTFANCSGIVIPPEIPSTVTNMERAFFQCYALTQAPELPSGVTNINSAFSSCWVLTKGPRIPNSVTNIAYLFSYCTELTDVTIDVEDYTDFSVSYLFYNDTSLQNIYVPSETAKSTLISKLGSNDFPSSLDKNEIIKVINTTTLANLNTLLQSLSENTVSTPYEIIITDLTAADLASSSTSGTLGYILNQNSAKYISLKYTNFPNNLTSLINTFNGCTNLINVPDIPSTVTDLTNTFSGCINLKNVTSNIDDYTNVTTTGSFYNCTSLEKINVSSATAKTTLSNKLIQPNDFPSSLDKNSVISYGYTCTLSELDALLTSLAENTTSTSYPINITDLTIADCGSAADTGTLGNILRNHSTKFVDLRPTSYPTGLTELLNTFNGVTNIVYSPEIPSTVTNMNGTYRGTNNLVEIPAIPSGVTTMSYAFRNCASVVDASNIVIPNSATNVSNIFSGCTSLIRAPEIPSTATSVSGAFNDCTSLRSAIINIPDYKNITVSTIFANCTNLRAVYVPDYTAKDSLISKLTLADFPSTLNKNEVIKIMTYYNVSSYLTALQNNRADLADNLVEQGVVASEEEKLDTLVPKVLDISGGGDSPVVEPYAILTAQGWVGAGNGLYTAQTGSGNTTLCFEVVAGRRYIIMASDTPGTRFRWMFSTVDCSPNTQNVQGTSVYNGTTVAAYFTYTYLPDTTGYLTGTVDNASAFNTKAYLIDITKMMS